MSRNRQVPCPVCRKHVDWDADDAIWRPFCSERCKMVDLGSWLQEENRIPGMELPEEYLDELDIRDDSAND